MFDVTKRSAINNGPPIGSLIENDQWLNWDDSLVSLYELKGQKMLIFISLFCSNCVDLLPQLTSFMEKYPLSYILVTDGNQEDHKEMASYFEWDFPLIHMEDYEMEKEYQITTTPSIIYMDDACNVINSGVINNINDLEQIMNLASKGGEKNGTM